MNSKNVNRDILNDFRFELNIIRDNPTTKDIQKLIKYYDKNILEVEKEEINGLKKIIYALMTRYKKLEDIEQSKKYYDLYQDLKNNKISYQEAYNKFFEMES